MLPNLNAEQARHNHSNQYVAEKLSLKRGAYETKKRNGRFTLQEINAICKMYDCDYDYLFSEKPINLQKTA